MAKARGCSLPTAQAVLSPLPALLSFSCICLYGLGSTSRLVSPPPPCHCEFPFLHGCHTENCVFLSALKGKCPHFYSAVFFREKSKSRRKILLQAELFHVGFFLKKQLFSKCTCHLLRKNQSALNIFVKKRIVTKKCPVY